MIRSAILASGLLATLLPGAVAEAGDLEVMVNGIRDDSGTVRVALYGDAGAFMKTGAETAATFQKSSAGSMRFVFAGLATGTYALAVFHDADSDGALDTNMLGMPTEGYGFSNDARGGFGPPRFAEAAIAVPAEGKARTTVQLGY
ncbi:MAG: DUF2141 domain-containing protein [Pseudomonadota bacterium]|nr:DUF2141 domain-containing protein [Pseudomonadota bacterium]